MLQVWTAEKPHPQEEVRNTEKELLYCHKNNLDETYPQYQRCVIIFVSVPGLPLGSDPEAEERPLAGATHPTSVHRFRQRAL